MPKPPALQLPLRASPKGHLLPIISLSFSSFTLVLWSTMMYNFSIYMFSFRYLNLPSQLRPLIFHDTSFIKDGRRELIIFREDIGLSLVKEYFPILVDHFTSGFFSCFQQCELDSACGWAFPHLVQLEPFGEGIQHRLGVAPSPYRFDGLALVNPRECESIDIG